MDENSEKSAKINGSDRRFLGWLIETLKISDEKVLFDVGLEGALYLSFQKVLIATVLLISIVTAPILVPIHNSLKNNEKAAIKALALRTKASDAAVVYTRGFSNWTVKNVEQADDILWVHLVVFVIISVGLYIAAARATLSFYVLRRKFYENKRNNNVLPEDYTVMIRGLPCEVENPEAVVEVLDKMYPGQVVSVTLAKHMPKALLIKQERAKAKENLDHYVALKEEMKGTLIRTF